MPNVNQNVYKAANPSICWGERDRQTDRHRQRQRDRETETETDRDRDRQTDILAYRQRGNVEGREREVRRIVPGVVHMRKGTNRETDINSFPSVIYHYNVTVMVGR